MRKKRAEGIDIIDFGIGDPDLPTPPAIVEEVKRQLDDPANHRYPSSSGEPEVRRAVADWYKKRFNVSLDPDGEVAILIGGKEGIANICRAFVNPGEKVLCPDPGYPVYSQGGTLLSDAVPVKVPIRPERDFLPDLDSLPSDARLFYLNYPNNPTGAVVTKEFLWRATTWCTETDTIFCYDNAYSEMTFDDYVAPSCLGLLPGRPTDRVRDIVEDVQHDRLPHRLRRGGRQVGGWTEEGEGPDRLRGPDVHPEGHDQGAGDVQRSGEAPGGHGQHQGLPGKAQRAGEGIARPGLSRSTRPRERSISGSMWTCPP